MKTRSVTLVALLLALPGCETSPGITTPLGDGAVLHFDAAMLANRDGGPVSEDAGTTRPELPPASVSPDGVLTPFPHLRVSVAPVGYTITTLNFVVEHDGDSRGPLLTMYAEVRNDGFEIDCGFLPDVWLDGTEIVTVLEAEPYYDRYSSGMLSTVTSDCLAPGAVGVMKGVQRAADPASASTLTIDAHPFRSSFAEHIAATDAPSLDIAVVETAEGWAVSGTMTPRRAIRNYGYRAFVRDARGVLVDELLAFPGELASLPGFLPQTLQTTSAGASFTEFRAFQSWINQ